MVRYLALGNKHKMMVTVRGTVFMDLAQNSRENIRLVPCLTSEIISWEWVVGTWPGKYLHQNICTIGALLHLCYTGNSDRKNTKLLVERSSQSVTRNKIFYRWIFVSSVTSEIHVRKYLLDKSPIKKNFRVDPNVSFWSLFKSSI